MIRALLRKRSGPAGAAQVLGVTSCHDAGMTHDMSPNEELTTATRVGVEDEFGGTGALSGAWTAQAARRNGMRTRARSLLANRRFEIGTTITVPFDWACARYSTEPNGLTVRENVFSVSP